MIKDHCKIISSFLTHQVSIWTMVIAMSFGVSQASAQTCFSTYVQRDTVAMQVSLGSCEVTSEEILARIGLQGCTHASLSVTKVGVNDTRTVYVYNENTQAIEDVIVVKTTVVPAQVPSIIRLQFGTNDCIFTKENLLDELNVVSDVAIRSNVHFISGTSRLREFPYGDTITIDRVVCGEGYTYARDVKLIMEPSVARLQGNVINYNAGFTTQKIDVETILRGYQFFHYTCDIDRFTIENPGPFGYGRHRIGDIYIDNALIAKDLEVVINGGFCPSILRDMILDEGQCYLNKADILDTLGFDERSDDYGRVQLTLDAGESLEDENFTIKRITVDGYPVCTADIPVNYLRQTTIDDESTLACNDVLNISLDAECQVMLNSLVILENGDYCYLNYVVTATDSRGALVDQGHTIVLTEPGQYDVTIRNPRSGASCQTLVNIEDKHIYDVTCPPDTIQCHYGIEPSDSLGTAFPYVGTPSTYHPTGEYGHYTVRNDMNCAIKFAEYQDFEHQKCVDEYKEIIRRVWTFSDVSGNVDTCHQYIYVIKTPLDSVDSFLPYTTACIEDFEHLDDNGHPSPSETGLPTINGGKYSAKICNTLKMTYSDNTFPLCGKSFKIVRDWSIIDWCTDVVTRRTQSIYIEDNRAPELLDTIADLHLDSHPFICGAEDVALPSPQYVDCGSDAVTVSVSYEVFEGRTRRVVDNGTSLTIPSVSFEGMDGSFEVYYHLTDECGNTANDTMRVYITDNQPPVAVCNQNTSISIAGGGEAQVKALTFDDLSVDNCGIAKYEARKIDGECYVDTAFSELLLFCCEEVGQRIKVEFRVTDLSGNTNTCEVYVEVFDKFRPVISCPAPITIDCGVDYTDLDITGRPDAIDNCTIDSLYYTDDVQLNDCGHGRIVRTWTVRDRSGEPVTCPQVITVESAEPFEMTDDMYPADTVMTGCLATIDPEFTGRPDVSSANDCSDVLISYEDTPFYDVNGACFKIIREWTVIDWCQFSTSSGSNKGRWVKPQAIKVNNTIAPTFVNMPNDTVLCTYGQACDDEVTFTAEAMDDCSPAGELDWYYAVYRSADDVRLKTGTSARVTASLPQGDYYIKYSVSDGCDNISDTTIQITVVDCRAPEIDCPDAIIGSILGADGTSTLHIDDIAVTATDNCTPSRDITFSFSDTAQVLTRTFSCDDVTNGVSEDHIIQIYATDGDGNTAFCHMVVQVIDGPANVCTDVVTETMDTLMVAGLIATDITAPVDNVSVYITAPNGQTKFYTTTQDGRFAFSALERYEDYTLSFERNTQVDDGVSVTDIVLIKRYILGLSSFDSPYHVIASDINNDRRVSVGDVAKLQRILLLRDTEFDRGQKSWRFVRTDHTFTNIHKPFPYPETITVSDLRESQMQLNMMAVKIGDVNGSNYINTSYQAGSRSAAATVISTPEQMIKHGQTIDIPVTLDDMDAILGLQLSASGDDLQWGVRDGAIALSDDDYILTEDGVSLVWSQAHEQQMDTDEPLFYLSIYNTGAERSLSEVLTLSGQVVGGDLTESSVELRYTTADAPGPMEITRVAPIPFADYTYVHIDSDRDQLVELAIYTMDGLQIYEAKESITKGASRVKLDLSHLGNTGVMILRAQTLHSTSTQKIIRVQ